MRKLFALLFAVSVSGIAIAGGIVTNTNQSAMFTRLQARDATLGIDAAYFNPAGLTLLPNDGFFISLNNQTLGQTRTVNSDYALLNEKEFIGNVSAPFFPGFYAAWKKGNLAISAGFNPIGGGGGGTYDKGLPSFEYDVADIGSALTLQGVENIDDYSVNIFFEGSSVYFGYQANISYKISDMFSVAIGGRYVTAKESYVGHLRDAMLNFRGTLTPIPDVFSTLATEATAGAAMATGAASSMQPLIDGGAGGLTLAQAEAGGFIDATTRAQLEGGLTALGIDPTGLTIAQAQGAYTTAAGELTASAATASENAEATTVLLDQEVDYEKTASGFTPIISVNIKPIEQLNIALKYEHKTKLEFENSTSKDFIVGSDPETGVPITMFPDGEKSRYDIPAQIVVGLTYQVFDPLLVSTGFHYYLDKNADWDGREEYLDANSFEWGFGLEYNISEKFLVSAGYLLTKSGVSKDYQTDLSYSLPSNSVGGGFAFQVFPMLEVNLGGSYTMYKEGDRTFDHLFAGMYPSEVTETYDKDVWIVAIGLNFNFGATK